MSPKILNFAYPGKADCDLVEAGMFLWLVWSWDSARNVLKSALASYLPQGDMKNLLSLAVIWPNVRSVQGTFVTCSPSLYIFLPTCPPIRKWKRAKASSWRANWRRRQSFSRVKIIPLPSFHLLNPVTLKSVVSNEPASSGCSASPCHGCTARRTPARSDALQARHNQDAESVRPRRYRICASASGWVSRKGRSHW